MPEPGVSSYAALEDVPHESGEIQMQFVIHATRPVWRARARQRRSTDMDGRAVAVAVAVAAEREGRG